jgi:mannose-6-phosphate isomerase
MGKVLHIKTGKRISLQIHDNKQESWFILKGEANILWEDKNGNLIETKMEKGVGYTTQVGQIHRLISTKTCDILEVSTSKKEQL